MNNNHSENSNIENVSFNDLWRVLMHYYYVILLAVVISLGSAILYIQGNPLKLRYVSTVIIESSSYYGVNHGEYYQKFLPFTNGVKNSEFLEMFFPKGAFQFRVANANRFLEIQVSSLRSSKDSVDSLSGYVNFLKKEQENWLQTKRAGILTELSLVEAQLSNVNSKLLSIGEKNSIKVIDEKILATEAIIKKLEELGNGLTISQDSISTLSESALQPIDRSGGQQTPSIQEMVLIGLLSDGIFFKNMKNPDSEWEIYIDKLRQSQSDLEMKKSELEYILDNQTNLRLYSDIEQTTTPASMGPVLLILLSVAFGFGLGVVLTFLINFIVSSKVFDSRNH
jgi:hypothetical protein